jgi:hypothetical protein
VTFTTPAASRAVTIQKGKVTFATGAQVSGRHASIEFIVNSKRHLAPGRYRLIVRGQDGRASDTTTSWISIR